jgi:hypothetical protein
MRETFLIPHIIGGPHLNVQWDVRWQYHLRLQWGVRRQYLHLQWGVRWQYLRLQWGVRWQYLRLQWGVRRQYLHLHVQLQYLPLQPPPHACVRRHLSLGLHLKSLGWRRAVPTGRHHREVVSNHQPSSV